MIVIDDLQSVTTDSTTLENYLSENFVEVYDLFNHTRHASLLEAREKINGYIRLNRHVLLQLDISNTTNLSFIFLLLDISERLGLLASFRYLYEYLQGKNCKIGFRLQAASKYLIGIITASDYLNRYDSICIQLQLSFETEEDSADKILMTFVNYYAEVINNFGRFNTAAIADLKGKIENTLAASKFSFLKNSLLEDVLKIDLSDFNLAYQAIHSALDAFLGRDIEKPAVKKGFLLEKGTEYESLLQNVTPDFKAIQQISIKKYTAIKNNSIFDSLEKGVAILTEESQLFAYMYSYGDMHFNKLFTSFEFLPEEFFQKEISITDWGCGQGIATMTFFDYLNKNDKKMEIKIATLIDASEKALERASLHITKFNNRVKINTVNKDLDSLVNNNFEGKKSITKLHLFSNILDIDLPQNQGGFSLTNLLNLIKSNFEGENYFVCVSPYNSVRLDSFMNTFQKNNCKVFKSIDNRKGEWNGTNWARVVRVFRATL